MASNGAPTAAGPDSHDALNPDNDVCPVCKTSRYMMKSLKLLINPECYHQMCATCVDRIFADGPAQCPHAGCHRTLRKMRFRPAYFEDLLVEREVDVRKRVAEVLNKVQDDFQTLDDYNEYLEWVEGLTMDLVSGSDEARARAERQISEWEVAHRAEIERNKLAGREAEKARQRRAAAEAEAQRQRRLDAIKEDEEERRREAHLREEMLNGLARAESGSGAVRNVVNRVMLKKRGQGRPSALEEEAALRNAGTPKLTIRGLKEKKKRRIRDAPAPYDPFGGLDLALTRYRFAEKSTYHSPWVDDARMRPEMRTGGYSAAEYVSRAMFEAFSGLGVFIGDEKDKETSMDGVLGEGIAAT